MELLIVGDGEYGRLVKEISELNGFSKVDFLGDNSPLAIGKIDELEKIERDYDGSIVAIGNPEIREKILRRLKRPVSVIHPAAVVSKNAIIGNGYVVEAHAVVNSEAIVRDSSFICAGAVVNHNSVVNEFCQIDCNAVVAMETEVPKGHIVGSCTVFKKFEMIKEQENCSFF